jgi:hypothetical protein
MRSALLRHPQTMPCGKPHQARNSTKPILVRQIQNRISRRKNDSWQQECSSASPNFARTKVIIGILAALTGTAAAQPPSHGPRQRTSPDHRRRLPATGLPAFNRNSRLLPANRRPIERSNASCNPCATSRRDHRQGVKGSPLQLLKHSASSSSRLRSQPISPSGSNVPLPPDAPAY